VSNVRYSIILTCFNQQDFIKHAVDSVLSQAVTSREVIVVDDGSTDGSIQTLQQYAELVTVVALSVNVGVCEARNRGAALARGEYVIFLDGDDLFAPWALEVYERLINERQPAAIVSEALWFEGQVPVLRAADRPKTLEFIEYQSLICKDRASGIYTGAFVINRSAFNAVGGWSSDIWHLDGHDLYAKLAYSGRALLVLSPYTMLYRMHAHNSIRLVQPYVRAAHLFIDKEQSGQYPGGTNKRFERYSRHGGVIFFCVAKLCRAGLYADAARLALRGHEMIAAAVLARLSVRFRGRIRPRTLDLNTQEASQDETMVRRSGT
jgi:glycosyltransferase involved in cell wall biosynthesis